MQEILSSSRKIVAFTCDFGSALGRWMGENLPQPGLCTVEIEVPDEVSEWVPIGPGIATISGALEPSSDVRIECEILRIADGDDDPIVEVGLGTDVLLVEILKRRAELLVGSRISFRVPEVQLYPYDI